jgi:Tol biopolymer transport system component
MAHPTEPTPGLPGTAYSGNERLDSWKEIAAYFRRDESTVRRWEKAGLPIHRHIHKSKAAVFAYRAELEAWWKQDPAVRGNVEAPLPKVLPWFQRVRWPVAGINIAALLFVVVAARLLWPGGRPSSAPPTVTLAPFMNTEGELSYPAISPDGKQVAFAWINRDLPSLELFVKLVGSEAPLRLTYNNDAEDFAPAWSPDGKQIAFLRRSDSQAGIFVMSALGGAERKLRRLRPDRYYALDWSPDGKEIAFARRESLDDPYCVFLLSLENGQERQVTHPSQRRAVGDYGDLHFAFAPDGKNLALLRYGDPDGQISVEILPLAGPAKPNIIASYNEWIGNIAWTQDGGSLLVTGNRHGVRKLWRVYLNGHREEPLNEVGENAYYPTVSRQSGELAFVREQSDSDLWRAELGPKHGLSKAVRVVFSTREEGAPRFSPDGKKISFMSYRNGTPELWTCDPDGSNPVQLTFLQTAKPEFPTWSPDGEIIAFAGGTPFQLTSAAGGKLRRFSGDLASFSYPSWSRDGHFIYFSKRSEGGAWGIWKIPASGGPAVRSARNGISSMESPDGKFLYFTKGDTAGIWKMQVNGGEESLVVEKQPLDFPGYWSVFDDGIYFLNFEAKPRPTIEFFSFAMRTSTPVVELQGQPDPWHGGLTVSPDRRLIIFSQQQYASSEIVLGQNFR